MKQMIALAAILVPSLTGAQSLSNEQPTMNMPNYSTFQTNPFGYGSTGDTPVMRRQKAVRAVALREEARRLLAEDGGTFTPEHQAYVQRKARAILASRR